MRPLSLCLHPGQWPHTACEGPPHGQPAPEENYFWSLFHVFPGKRQTWVNKTNRGKKKCSCCPVIIAETTPITHSPPLPPIFKTICLREFFEILFARVESWGPHWSLGLSQASFNSDHVLSNMSDILWCCYYGLALAVCCRFHIWDEWCGLRVVWRVAMAPESMDRVGAALEYP